MTTATWTNTKNALPAYGRTVLAVCDGGRFYIVKLIEGKKGKDYWRSLNQSVAMDRVNAWLDVPEVPAWAKIRRTQVVTTASLGKAAKIMAPLYGTGMSAARAMGPVRSGW